MDRLDEMVLLLRSVGPLMADEIAVEMRICRQNVDTLIRRARRKGKPRRIYVKEWLEAPVVPCRTRVWAAGSRPDAPEPVYSKRKAHARYEQRAREQRAMLANLAANSGNPFRTLITQVTK